MIQFSKKSWRGSLPFWLLLPLFLFIFACAVGPYSLSPRTILSILWEKLSGTPSGADELSKSLLLLTRLPRVLASLLVGAGLASSGAVFQALFRNPLASPYTLGVSNGAGFGAALAIVMNAGIFAVQGLSVAFGLLSIVFTFLLAWRQKKSTVTLLLAGLLVSSLFSSLVALMKFVADPFEKLPQIVYWLMGSLNGVGIEKILPILPLYLVLLGLLFAYRWRINVLSLGESQARAFGISVSRDRQILLIASSVLTALVVSLSGIIGWVGIVIPHLARMIVGADFRKILPVSLSLGMSYLILIDTLCRTLSSQEIPIGVVTGIVGTPLFFYLILKQKVSLNS